jgi:peroxiredoxin
MLVVFYLGRGCLHCSRQLKHLAPAAADFEDLGISILGISTDSAVALTESFAAYDGRIPYPLVADVEKSAFKSYRLFEDGDEEALHGTFLVDADGSILWRDSGEEPFMDMDFLLRESKRLLKTRKQNSSVVAAN